LIVGTGLDLVETQRISQVLHTHGDRFVDKVYTAHERSYCAAGNTVQRLAARFAAKEAVMKALGTGWSTGVGWKSIEIISSGGKPEVALHGPAQAVAARLGIAYIHLSLSHTATTAGAVAIAESEAVPRG